MSFISKLRHGGLSVAAEGRLGQMAATVGERERGLPMAPEIQTTLNEPQPTPGLAKRVIRAGPAVIAARRGARPASPPAVPGPHVARCAGS